ncbi:MAG: acetyl-CoA carboxylase carboxyltransferase subunit alpha [Actinobacteria bacterium]|nr:acetyl-CoA carboxylase carboxyltransferase subunit alpha [Actinomycetota bacterium]
MIDLNNLKTLPKNHFKEILTSMFKLEKIRKISHSTGIHFNDAEKELAQKIENYQTVEREAVRTWKIIELSRDEKRPHTPDYINGIFEDFVEFSGDRLVSNDRAIIAGFGKIEGKTVVVIGHNKGKDIKERVEFNFGMSTPQGYRKSQRIMQLADRFNFPVITFIDTPGAYSAPEAEDNGQAGAIAKSILNMFELKIPVISIVIGEGGSGGALAMAIGNTVLMLENSIYSVISPEGCASILWRDSSVAKLAARSLKLTSRDLLKLGVIDKIIYEPVGGAQSNPNRMVRILKRHIIIALNRYENIPGADLKKQRAEKFEAMGFFELFSNK